MAEEMENTKENFESIVRYLKEKGFKFIDVHFLQSVCEKKSGEEGVYEIVINKGFITSVKGLYNWPLTLSYIDMMQIPTINDFKKVVSFTGDPDLRSVFLA